MKRTPFFPALGLSIAVAVAAVNGCTDRDYDLSQPIDTTISINGDFSMPLGYTEFIPIVDFLGLDSDLINTDSDGNYYFNFLTPADIADSLDTSFSISMADPETVTVNLDLSEEESYIGQRIEDFIDNVENPVVGDIPEDAAVTLSVDEELPSWIIDISHISTDSKINILLTASEDAVITLKSGTLITFPEYFTLDGDISYHGYKVNSANEIIFTDDMDVDSGGTPVEIALSGIDFTALPSGMGVVEQEDGSRKVIIGSDDEPQTVTITGETSLDLYCFEIMPESVSLYIALVPEDINVTESTVRISLDHDIPDTESVIEDIPDIISAESTVIDLYNPVVTFTAHNGTPVDMILDFDVNAYRDGASFVDPPIHIGSNGDPDNSTDPFIIEANSSSILHISKIGHDNPEEGSSEIVVPRLGELFVPIPDMIGVENIRLTSDSEKYVTVPSGVYDSSSSCRIDALLAFGHDLYLTYDEAVTGLNIVLNKDDEGDFSYAIDSLELNFNFRNTIPVGFEVTARPIDEDGTYRDDIELTIAGYIEPGTDENPSDSPVTITLYAAKEIMSAFDGVMMSIIGTSNESVEGEPLNTVQGLQLIDITAKINGGFTLKL